MTIKNSKAKLSSCSGQMWKGANDKTLKAPASSATTMDERHDSERIKEERSNEKKRTGTRTLVFSRIHQSALFDQQHL
ncbi:MAG: hypothetical protein Q7U12_09415, partial [Undibacterium sp.]|nr:hypothetical protein [Undibacterium sp.]